MELYKSFYQEPKRVLLWGQAKEPFMVIVTIFRAYIYIVIQWADDERVSNLWEVLFERSSLIICNLETAGQSGKPKKLTHQLQWIRLCMTGYKDDIKWWALQANIIKIWIGNYFPFQLRRIIRSISERPGDKIESSKPGFWQSFPEPIGRMRAKVQLMSIYFQNKIWMNSMPAQRHKYKCILYSFLPETL